MIKNFIKYAIVGKVTLATIKRATPSIKKAARKVKSLVKRSR